MALTVTSVFKLVAKQTRAQPKPLVCKLLGSPATKPVNFGRGTNVEKLQRQVKEQFGSTMKAHDLKLFAAVNKHGDRWLNLNDKAVDALSKGETTDEVKDMLRARSDCIFRYDLLKLLDAAPHDMSVIYILVKECPVHRLPTWGQLYEDVYAPQLEPYKEPVAPVDYKTLDELISTLRLPLDKQMNDSDRELCVCNMIYWRTHEHPDLSYVSRIPLDSSRVDYHVYGACVVMYMDQAQFVAEYNCDDDDVEEGITRVLTALEVVADNNDSHEVFGAVVTKDHRWIFVRSLDNKILIDGDAENRLEWDEDGRPDREKLIKIIGKLHGMIMTNVPAAEPNWREKEKEEWRRLYGDDEDDEESDDES